MFGKNITQMNDVLQKASIEQIYQWIKTSEKLHTTIDTLRTMKNISLDAYHKSKRELPYFTSSVFNPPFRKKENFAYTQFMVIDIDHLHKEELFQLKEKLIHDEEIMLAFVSPGGDGIKVLCMFNEKIYDASIYTLLYKYYIRLFADRYQLVQVDMKTHDVTRATFFSYDPEAFLNPQAKPLNVQKLFNETTPELISQMEKEVKQDLQHTEHKEIKPLDDDVMTMIKQKLQQRPPVVKDKVIINPQPLNELAPIIVNHLNQSGMPVESIEPIQYGKKIRVKIGLLWAEVNVFYGKKGFSVVKTPKNGSNAELCELVYREILSIINQIQF